MTAEDIEIPGAPKPAKPQTSDAPASVPRAPEPISEHALEELRKKPTTKINGMEVLGDYQQFPDLTDIPIRFCCHCKRWELTKEAERIEYGDLIARSQAPNPHIEITWEERCKEADGLVIYLTFFEFVRVAEVKNA
jgi:hypothetical protein